MVRAIGFDGDRREKDVLPGRAFDLKGEEEAVMREGQRLLISHDLRRTRSSTMGEEPLEHTGWQSPAGSLKLRRALSSTILSIESLVDSQPVVKTRKRRQLQLMALPVRSGGEEESGIDCENRSDDAAAENENEGVVHVPLNPTRSLSINWDELSLSESDEDDHRSWDAPNLRLDEEETRSSPGRGKIRKTGSFGSHVYICNSRTENSLVTHELLRRSMRELKHWTIQEPANCCIGYKHDICGEGVTLPWPDMEACVPEEIHDFVNTVNRVEGKTVFFSRYERSPYSLSK